MKFMEKIAEWILCRISPNHPKQPELLTIIQNSFREWQIVSTQYNFVESGLVDYMIYRWNAAERHFTALLAQAKAEGLKAWPDNLRSEIRGVRSDHQQCAE